MSIITKIEVQKNNKDRVNIYVDEEFFAGLDLELVYTLNLSKGQSIDAERMKEIIYKDNISKVKSKALKIINKAEQSEKTLRDKLKDYDEEIVDIVIEYLKDCKFINDKDFAKRIASSNSNVSKFGKNKIKQNLYKKGIDREYIDEAIEEIDEDVEFENAVYLAEKRYKSVKNDDKRKVYQKLIQHLTYKGFSYDISKRAISHVLDNLDEINDYDNY